VITHGLTITSQMSRLIHLRSSISRPLPPHFRFLCDLKLSQLFGQYNCSSLIKTSFKASQAFHSTVANAKSSQQDFEDGAIPRIDWYAVGEDGEPPATPRARAVAEEILKLSMDEIDQLQRLYRMRIGLTQEQIESIFVPVGVPTGTATDSQPEAQQEVQEEKTQFDIKVTSFDAKSKIKVIKEVRSITGLGLKEAKEIVENLPKKIKEGLKKEEADELIEKLKAAGAEVELE